MEGQSCSSSICSTCSLDDDPLGPPSGYYLF